MKRIIIVVEGVTEERFVRGVLYPHFILIGLSVEPQQWITNRKLGVAGGGRSFNLIENHVRRQMARYGTDQNMYLSVMIDLYAFPRQGNSIYDDDVISAREGSEKVILLEEKMKTLFNYYRFIPYVQLHEFETLLFSKPEALRHFFTDKENGINALKLETSGLSPENINDTRENAPSKRIIRHIPQYERQKATAGPITAQQIGLPLLREKCPHFNEWILKLENIAGT
jgi:hypothetical protein